MICLYGGLRLFQQLFCFIMAFRGKVTSSICLLILTESVVMLILQHWVPRREIHYYHFNSVTICAACDTECCILSIRQWLDQIDELLVWWFTPLILHHRVPRREVHYYHFNSVTICAACDTECCILSIRQWQDQIDELLVWWFTPLILHHRVPRRKDHYYHCF